MKKTPDDALMEFDTRSARKQFSTLTNSTSVSVITNKGTPRAMIVPFPEFNRWRSAEHAKALVVAQGRANEAFRALRKGFE